MIYQDSEGTIPATRDGDPAGRWDDLIQEDDEKKPTLRLEVNE